MNRTIMEIIAALAIGGLLISGYIDVTNQRNVALETTGQLSTAYENHLYAEYTKNICEVEAPKLNGTDNRAGTAKEVACMAGVREQARKEVGAVTKK